jgi:hypothetical protein
VAAVSRWSVVGGRWSLGGGEVRRETLNSSPPPPHTHTHTSPLPRSQQVQGKGKSREWGRRSRSADLLGVHEAHPEFRFHALLVSSRSLRPRMSDRRRDLSTPAEHPTPPPNAAVDDCESEESRYPLPPFNPIGISLARPWRYFVILSTPQAISTTYWAAGEGRAEIARLLARRLNSPSHAHFQSSIYSSDLTTESSTPLDTIKIKLSLEYFPSFSRAKYFTVRLRLSSSTRALLTRKIFVLPFIPKDSYP